MAHPCIECGSECYCDGDIDDCVVSHTPASCETCGCDDEVNDDFDDDDDDDDDDFRCSHCDGHDACADFGCAIEAGIIEPTNILTNQTYGNLHQNSKRDPQRSQEKTGTCK